MMEFKLKYYRSQKKLTQEQLAGKLNVDQSTISKWESTNSFDQELIIRLCEELGCSPNQLFGFK